MITHMLLLVGVVYSSACFAAEEQATTPNEGEELRLETIDPAERATWALPRPEDALDLARKIVGFTETAAFSAESRLVKLSDDNTPFLKKEFIGRPIWDVVLTDWSVALKSDPDARDRYRRTLDVYLDPANGKTLKVVSRWPEGAPPMRPMPGAEEAEAKFRGKGQEFHGFPADSPPISFVEALDTVQREGFGDVLEASQIMANCVLWSNMGREPRPVWVVTLWGIPPVRTPTSNAPVEARRCFTTVIDARTGQFIIAGNTLCSERQDGAASPKKKHPPAP